jgi:hypothetical protein
VLIHRDGLLPACWHAQWREAKNISLLYLFN